MHKFLNDLHLFLYLVLIKIANYPSYYETCLLLTLVLHYIGTGVLIFLRIMCLQVISEHPRSPSELLLYQFILHTFSAVECLYLTLKS